MHLSRLLVRSLAGGVLLTQSSCIGLSFVVGSKPDTIGDAFTKRRGQAPAYDDKQLYYTRQADALRLWGQPWRKQVRDGHELWTYKTLRPKWRGLEVWGIIAVPLLLPAGFKKVMLEFEGDKLVRYTRDSGRGYFVGYFVSNATPRVWWFFEEDRTYEGYWGSY